MKLGVLSPALSCLSTPKFMIYLFANRLRYSCFAIVINYSHCKRTLCFQAKKASIPRALLYVDFLCTKKEIFEAYRLEILRLWEQQRRVFRGSKKSGNLSSFPINSLNIPHG